jgi:DNA-binding winged helix-turn-helix (wHTH) protein
MVFLGRGWIRRIDVFVPAHSAQVPVRGREFIPKTLENFSELCSDAVMAMTYGFGPFRLETESETLLRGTERVALGRRAVALLRALIERPGQVLAKAELIEAAWSKLAVEDSNLTVQIAAVRRALNGERGGKQWIETLPCRGYRYVGPPPSALQNAWADFDLTFDDTGDQQLNIIAPQVHVDRSHAAPMRMIFILMDTDGDGSISLQEFQAAQERVFKAMDANKDGVITLDEMRAFMQGRSAAPRSTMRVR